MSGIKLGKVVLMSLLLLVVAAGFVARPQEASQILTVCPEGPPACQFQRIQDAINASPDGATIEVGPGVYQGNLFIFHSLKLFGAGPDRTEIRSLSTIEGRDVILVYGGFVDPPGIEVTIEGFKITGTPRKGLAIQMERVFKSSLQGNIIGGGVYLRYAFLIEIQGNTLQGGLGIEDSGLITIQDNLIQGGRNGIGIGSSEEVNFHNNIIQNNRAWGINLDSLSRSHIVGNIIKDNGFDGISVDGSVEIIISGNTIENNGWDGIDLDLKSEVIVTNNMIEGNGKSGIQIKDAARASIEANTIRNNQRYGILVEVLENVTVCRLNKVEGNEKGDYAVGPSYPLPPPSEELRQMCEGGE